jgi:quercetin dioxygenase-like cupin family protein
MPVIHAAEAEVHELHNARFISYARPGTGSRELCLWQVRIAAGSEGQTHTVLREEVFAVIEGEVVLTVDGAAHPLSSGDAAIALAGSAIRLDNPGERAAMLIVTVPVGFSAELADGTRIVPPWVS